MSADYTSPPPAPLLIPPQTNGASTTGYVDAVEPVPCLETRTGGALQFGLESIIGDSDAIRDALERARKVASSRLTTVLIVGETGHREGALRPRHPLRGRIARRAVRGGELRRDPRDAARVGALRPRARRLHRCARPEEGADGARRHRHALPRRDRRAAAAPPAEAAARARGAARAPPRRAAGDRDRLPDHHRGEQLAARCGGASRVPRGPLLPAQRLPDRAAAAAHARGRRRAARPPFPGRDRAAAGPRAEDARAAGGRGAARAQLAGEHPRAQERDRARRDPLRGAVDRRRAPDDPAAHEPARRRTRRRARRARS